LHACLGGEKRPVWITYAGDEASATALRDRVGSGAVLRCDVTEPADLARVADSVAEQGARIGTLIHSAVDARPGPLVELAPALLRAIDVSAVSLVKAVAAFNDLLDDGASVVYLTSIGASRVVPNYGAVGVAKAAAESIVRYLACELGGRGIRVNAVGSGPVATKALASMFGDADMAERIVNSAARMSPLQPPVGVADVASVVAFLCSPAGRGLTGSVLTVDGGGFLGVR
jgi:enoyl-[acyl-carrier protein] reductase I